MKRRNWFFGSCSAVVSVCVAVAVYFGSVRGRDPSIAAFFSRSGQVLAPVQIGGRCGWFLLDTGAQSTLVTPALASGLQPAGSTREVRSESSGNPALTVPKARSGGVRFASGRLRYPEEVDVMDLSHLAELLGHEVQGILGWDVLRAFVVGFDFGRGRLIAGRTLDAQAALAEFGIRGPDAALKLEILGNKPYVTAQSRDKRLTLMLDTGSSGTSLFRSARERVTPRPLPEGAERVAWTVTGEATGVADTLAELRLGPLHLTDVNIDVRSRDPEPVARGRDRVVFDGVFGMDLLARYVVVIDGPHEVLYLAERRPVR